MRRPLRLNLAFQFRLVTLAKYIRLARHDAYHDKYDGNANRDVYQSEVRGSRDRMFQIFRKFRIFLSLSLEPLT